MSDLSHYICLTEFEAKNASVHLELCEGRCDGCPCKTIIRTEFQERGLTLDSMRALPEKDKHLLAWEIKKIRDKVGERVEDGIWGCDHTDLYRFQPMPPSFFHVSDEEL